MRRSSLDKIRESLRLQQVYNVFLRYGWDILFERWELVGDFHRTMQAWVWDMPERQEPLPTGVKLRLLLEDLGPTYVKVGQIVSSQASVVPADWEVELEKLQSDARPFPSNEVREIIIEELKAPPEEVYASFEQEPFAAASTAQVHRAKLHDGTAVAVKVQRPHIAAEMKADIGIMQNAARVVSRSSEWAKSVDLVGMLEQFGTGALNELDYGGEAYNAYRLAANLETIPGVHIPTVYTDISTSRLLTLEFVKGVKISEVEKIRAAGLDPVMLARNAFRAIVKQVLIDGFFHADPHPGNILVNLNTGVITFIDTGMVGELDLSARMNIGQLLFAVSQGDITSMAQIMRDLSVPFVDYVDERAYYKDFERKIGRYFYAGTRVSFSQSVGVAFDLMREHGLRLDPNLTLAIKALMQAEAFTSALDPDGNIVGEAVSMIKDLLLQPTTLDMVGVEVKKQLTITGRELVKRIPSLSDATLKWVDQYQKGRFEVYVDSSGIAKEVDKLSRFGRLITIGILVAGMLIGSSIATSLMAMSATTTQYSWWMFMERLAFVGYLVAMLVAIIIVFRLLWDWITGKS